MAGTIMPGDASPSVAFLARPRHTSPAVRYIRQVAISVKSQRSVRKPAARNARGSVIPSWRDALYGGVSAGGFVGETPRQEELTTAGGIGGMSAASHSRQRQEAQQYEMVEGDDEFLDQSTRLLKRNAAGKVRLRLLQKSRHARQAVGGQPDVGVEKRKKRMASRLCQKRAGELLATPARRGEVVPARDGHGCLAPRWLKRHRPWRPRSDRPRPGLRARRPGWQGRHAQRRRSNVSSLRAGISTEIAGTAPSLPGRWCRRRRTICTQVGAKQERGDGGEDENDRSQTDRDHDGARGATTNLRHRARRGSPRP